MRTPIPSKLTQRRGVVENFNVPFSIVSDLNEAGVHQWWGVRKKDMPRLD